MQKFLPIVVALLIVGAAALAAPFENSSVVGHAPDRVLVVFDTGVKLNVDKSDGTPRVGVAALDDLAARHSVTEISQLYAGLYEHLADKASRDDLSRIYAIDFDPGKTNLDAVLADYRQADLVDQVFTVDICRMYGTAFFPNDLNNQYYLRNTTIGGGDVRALGGWAEALGDSNIIVAVGDSGVDWNHPDLGGTHPDKVNGSIWTNWAEYYGTPGVDDDANGKIDDIRGWDFVDLPPGSGWPGEDVEDQDNDPSDWDGHGTGCSGCIAPITNNGVGIAGTAPGCKIMALRVGWLPAGETQGVVRMDFASQAMLYASAMGAKIFNASWGSSSFLSFAVASCLNSGMLIFTAAGNDNDEEASYLCGYPDGSGSDTRVLAVAATNSSDGKASFSSYGTWVDLSAPGAGIYTTYYNYVAGESSYATVDGTSFASPLAAGAAALLWSANPSASNTAISSLLRSSCDNINALNPGYEGKLGAGRVNLLKALGDDVQQVPGEFTFISDAMNCAAVGDTIKVLGGHNLGATTMQGKNLQILGGYDASYAGRDVVGNPSLIQGLPTGPALQFFGAVTSDCVVDGFAVSGGGGRTFADIPYSGKYGGGIMLNQHSPTLRNFTVSGNSVGNSTTLGLGGGIAMYNSTAVLENFTVTGNSGMYGAGIFIYEGAPTLTNVTIDGNTLRQDNLTYPPRGGAMHIIDAAPMLTDVTCDNHTDAEKGGGIYAAGVNSTPSLTMTGGSVSGNSAKTNGAGICILGGALDLTDVVIDGNVQNAAATFMNGGGLFADGATVAIDGVTATGNSAHAGGGIQMINSPDVSVANTLVAGNTALIYGGNVHLGTTTAATLQNLTIADNNCPAGGAGLYSTGTTITVSNTISAFNTGGAAQANGMYIAGAATLTCNDVFGNDGSGYGGVADPTGTGGNIALDPQFCDRGTGDYRVNPSGPCAPANSGGCGLIGALEASCGGTNAVEDPQVPVAFRVDQAFPNPFNPMTSIRFALPAAARTSVVVYDVRGRTVKTLVNDNLPAATHVVRWQGDDDRGRAVSAGIYFYRVTSGDHTAVGRMALIK
jgi:subtilisin family serine protease